MSSIGYVGVNVYVHHLINAAGQFSWTFSLPSVSHIGGKSSLQLIQKIGRGLRRAEDKDVLQYFDFVFQKTKYLAEHSISRMKTLREQGYTIDSSGIAIEEE